MKVTVIGPVYPYRGGIANYTTSLSQNLLQAGHHVQTLSFKRQYPRWLYPGQSDKDPSQQHEQTPAEYVLDPMYFWTWISAYRQICAFQPDLVLFQWWTTFWGPAYYCLSLALKRCGIQVVFVIHNVIPHEKRLPDVWLSRRVLSNGWGYITLSPKETARLQQLIPGARVYPSRLPVPGVQRPAETREVIRDGLGIAADRPVLLFFGIIRPYKGLHVMLDALDILRKENMSPLLIVAGEFWEDHQGYTDKISRLAFGSQVLIENRYVTNEEMSRYFTAADAFVAPYIKGTQSAAIKMAMGYGLPILASDQISGDLPCDTYPVFVHQAGDAADLARSVRAFLESEPDPLKVANAQDSWPGFFSLLEQIRRDQ